MLSIVIPTYNEEEGIDQVLGEIKGVMAKLKEKSEIIVVDDGSQDRTAEIAKKHKVKLIRNPYNRGYGFSIKRGIKESKGDWILITDADGTYPVKDIPRLLEYTGEYDMVVGARTGKNVKIPLMRRPAKFMLGRVANYLTGVKIPDLNSGFRVFRKDIALRFFNLFPYGFSFTTTITMACLSNEYLVKYVPIDYHRRKGKSSMKRREFINFNILMLRMIMYFKPLKIFMPSAAVLFIIGIVLLLWDLIIRFNVTELSVMIILVSFLVGFLGLIADLVVKKTSE